MDPGFAAAAATAEAVYTATILVALEM